MDMMALSYVIINESVREKAWQDVTGCTCVFAMIGPALLHPKRR